MQWIVHCTLLAECVCLCICVCLCMLYTFGIYVCVRCAGSTLTALAAAVSPGPHFEKAAFPNLRATLCPPENHLHLH